MDSLMLRDPVSACSHGAWLLLSLPGTWLLWRRCHGNTVKRVSMLIFCVSLAFCYASSALYHGVVGPTESIRIFDQLDHVGIFILIAGSYTPLALGLLDGHWRWTTLTSSWVFAACGSTWFVASGGLPAPIVTGLYLVMGWGAVVCYCHIARYLSHRALFPLLGGGILYSVGAVLNVLHWPVIWPGVFRAHEVFHFFVMAGSLAHFWFMLKVVIPYSSAALAPAYGSVGSSEITRQNAWLDPTETAQTVGL
jgi:hemolysin III